LGATRLAIDFGATNLTVAFLRIKTPDPSVARLVTIAIPELADDSIREQTLCTGSIYRVDLNSKIESNLEIPIDAQIRGRELIVLINNGDSPPLIINARWDSTLFQCDMCPWEEVADERIAFVLEHAGGMTTLLG